MPTLDYINQLKQLVAAPSVSCATPQYDMGNMEVINLLATWLKDLDFKIEIIPIPGQKDKANLIATRGSGPGGLVLSGHADTVPYNAERWSQQDPLELTERDGRLYGLGATDMKGFFPAAIAAAAAFQDQEFKQPLIILATADEESSMSGARALAEMGAPIARYAVIGEPTGLRPIRMHKGIMMEAVKVIGNAGHSSNPALGNSALETMQAAMGELLTFRSEIQARYQNAGFDVSVPTLNLGCIHGGDNPNRICGQCELHFDLRALPGMDNEELHQAIAKRLQPLAELHGCDITLSSLFGGVEAFEQEAASPLIEACEKLTGHIAGSVAFATEAPFLQSLGMETVVMGPGSIDQAHQPDEFIPMDQIQPAIDLLKSLIRQFCL
jgi:acetylornithine deacetylase